MTNLRLGSGKAGEGSGSTELVTVLGYILTVSYPLLALSTGVRALFQLVLKEGVVNYLAPTLSLVAALCYLTATIGFARRVRWAGGFLSGSWPSRRLSPWLLAPEFDHPRNYRAYCLAPLRRRLRIFPSLPAADWPCLAFWPSIMQQYGLNIGQNRARSIPLKMGSRGR